MKRWLTGAILLGCGLGTAQATDYFSYWQVTPSTYCCAGTWVNIFSGAQPVPNNIFFAPGRPGKGCATIARQTGSYTAWPDVPRLSLHDFGVALGNNLDRCCPSPARQHCGVTTCCAIVNGAAVGCSTAGCPGGF